MLCRTSLQVSPSHYPDPEITNLEIYFSDCSSWWISPQDRWSGSLHLTLLSTLSLSRLKFRPLISCGYFLWSSYLQDISRLLSSSSHDSPHDCPHCSPRDVVTVVSLTDFPLLTTDDWLTARAEHAQACPLWLYRCTPPVHISPRSRVSIPNLSPATSQDPSSRLYCRSRPKINGPFSVRLNLISYFQFVTVELTQNTGPYQHYETGTGDRILKSVCPISTGRERWDITGRREKDGNFLFSFRFVSW